MSKPKSASAPKPEPLAVTFTTFYTTLYPCPRSRASEYVRDGELITFLDHGKRMVLMSEVKRFVAAKSKVKTKLDPVLQAKRAAAGKKSGGRGNHKKYRETAREVA